MLIIVATQVFTLILAMTSKLFDSHLLTTLAFSLILSCVFAFTIVRDPVLRRLASDDDSPFREINMVAEVLMWMSFLLVPLSLLFCLMLYGIDFINYFGDHLFEIKYYGAIVAYIITSFGTVSVISSEEKVENVLLKAIVSMSLNSISVFAVVYLIIIPLLQKYFPLLF